MSNRIPQAVTRGRVIAEKSMEKKRIEKYVKYGLAGAGIVGGSILLYELAKHGGHIHNITNIILGSVIGATVGTLVSDLINKVLKKL